MPDYHRKAMHTREVREVRYERGGERLLGKRDWQQQQQQQQQQAPVVQPPQLRPFDRAVPGLSSSNGGSYDPPSKRRPSGRHGFSAENGRCRDHTRLPEHQAVFGGAGYSGYHKTERYGTMNQAQPPSHYTRNGIRDVGDDYFREREPVLSPNQPMYDASSSFSDGHRGSRYGWSEQHHYREGMSSSPDMFDRKVGGVSRYGAGGGGWGYHEREIENRHDRYGSVRDIGLGPPAVTELRSSSVDLHEELTDPFVTSSSLSRFQQPRASSLEETVGSPRKKTRLTWGDGLASYEQKHVPKIKQEDELVSMNEAVPELNGEFKVAGDRDGDGDDYNRDSPPLRDPTPVRDAETVTEVTDALPMDAVPVEAFEVPPVMSPCISEPQQVVQEAAASIAAPPPIEAEETFVHQPEEEVPESTVKITKEDVLLQVEQVEFEIDSIEKELARLAVEVDADAVKVKGEQLVTETEEHSVLQPCHFKDATVLDDQEDFAVPDTALDLSTEKCLQEFAHLLPVDVRGKRLYSNPQEAAVWARNEELHQLNKSKMLERMLNKKTAMRTQEKSLVLKYRLLKEVAKTEIWPAKGLRKADAIPNGGEMVLDDSQLMKKVLSEPLCPYREALRMPSMILSRTERTVQHIITSNRLVEDPIACDQERKGINPWTAEERKLFVDKFAVFYKNFAKIASFLPHKTTGDCVEFYYRNQKSEDLIKLRKKQQKKRHSRASYLATTTTTGGRLRDSNAAAIHKLASAATYAGSNFGRLSRNHMKAGHRERLSLTSDCVTADAAVKETRSANISAGMSSIVTGVCSLSSDAPLTPSRVSCERAFPKDDHCTKQKGVRSSRGRREQAADEVEAEWTDAERELFVDAVLLFGKDFRSVALHIRTRNEGQCKTFFSKARKRLKLDRIVEQHLLAQAASVVEQPQIKMAVVNRACEDPAPVDEAGQDQDRLNNAADRSLDSEDMDVSIVVDSGLKEGTEAADPESNMEGISAAPAALVDSPVSSVITSPGLVSSSSPAIQASNVRIVAGDLGTVLESKQFHGQNDKADVLEKAGNDMSLISTSNKPLTETSEHTPCEANGSTAAKPRKRKLDEVDCSQARPQSSELTVKNEVPVSVASGLWSSVPGQQVPVPAPGLVSVLYQKQQAPQLQVPPVVLSEQQQLMIYKQLARQLQPQVSQQIQDEQSFQQGLSLQSQQRQQQPFSFLPQVHFQHAVKQENHYTNKLLAFQQAFLQQDQMVKQEQHLHDPHQIAQQQQHLLNLLTQQQQLALQLHQPQLSGSFSQQQKVPGLQLLENGGGGEGANNGPAAAKFLTSEFGDTLHFGDRRAGAKPVITCDEQLGRGSDIKLFGQSLLSQPTAAAASTSLMQKATKSAAPFLLGESWCSGSAEAQDRGMYHAAGGYSISGCLPDASGVDGLEWQRGVNGNNTCSREALNLWRKELLKSSTVLAAAAASGSISSFCQQQQQQQQQQIQQQIQEQHQQQQQQQQSLKDGMMFSSQVLQFANGSGWATTTNAQQARILAQLTLAEQQRQSL